MAASASALVPQSGQVVRREKESLIAAPSSRERHIAPKPRSLVRMILIVSGVALVGNWSPSAFATSPVAAVSSLGVASRATASSPEPVDIYRCAGQDRHGCLSLVQT